MGVALLAGATSGLIAAAVLLLVSRVLGGERVCGGTADCVGVDCHSSVVACHGGQIVPLAVLVGVACVLAVVVAVSVYRRQR